VDYFKIELKDAVGQVQPVDALTSCYITDPRADNPLCAAVTRDPTTGRIKDGFPVDHNLAFIKQAGFDVDLNYRQNAPFGLTGHRATWQYQAALVQSYSIQKNPVLDPIDCKGTYGVRCSSDVVSLVMPDYRHRVSLTWQGARQHAGQRRQHCRARLLRPQRVAEHAGGGFDREPGHR
jgi:iron complex outermembrane recepter protein